MLKHAEKSTFGGGPLDIPPPMMGGDDAYWQGVTPMMFEASYRDTMGRVWVKGGGWVCGSGLVFGGYLG